MSKKKQYQQYKDEYSELWPDFKRSKLSENHVFCTVCYTDINIAHGGEDDCQRHAESNRHLEKAKQKPSSSKKKMGSDSHIDSSVDYKAIRAESIWRGFLIKQNIPPDDEWGELFRQMFPDSAIAAKYGCARTEDDEELSTPDDGEELSTPDDDEQVSSPDDDEQVSSPDDDDELSIPEKTTDK